MNKKGQNLSLSRLSPPSIALIVALVLLILEKEAWAFFMVGASIVLAIIIYSKKS